MNVSPAAAVACGLNRGAGGLYGGCPSEVETGFCRRCVGVGLHPSLAVQERIGLQAVHRLRSTIVERARDSGGLRAGHRNHVPDLYSANVSYPGMNLQIAATLDRALIAVGPRPVHGARHDAHGSPR